MIVVLAGNCPAISIKLCHFSFGHVVYGMPHQLLDLYPLSFRYKQIDQSINTPMSQETLNDDYRYKAIIPAADARLDLAALFAAPVGAVWVFDLGAQDDQLHCLLAAVLHGSPNLTRHAILGKAISRQLTRKQRHSVEHLSRLRSNGTIGQPQFVSDPK
jgi:hypothetical protein